LSIVFLFFWLILALFWQFYAGFSDLNAFFFIKMVELIVLYGTTAVLFKEFTLKKPFFVFFSILAGLQSLIALAQFYLQQPIGLNKLGEQIILPQITGIAKLVVDGATYIRGYGTFPHPNPLSAFLIVGVFATLYLLVQKTRRWERGLYAILLLINVLGITTTFSRAAFLALFIGLIVFCGYLMFNGKQKITSTQSSSSEVKEQKKDSLPAEGERVRVGWVFGYLTMSILISFFIFKPFLLTRATVSDSASLERMAYNKIGVRMVKDAPIFGVGGGESVLHMEQFSDVKLWPWQKQPIHNFFLLAAAELGILGALILIWVFISHVWKLFKNLKLPARHQLEPQATAGRKIENSEPTYYLLLATIFLCFLVLMLFDHYFYTLQQTQMLLWLILGLIAAEIKTP